MTYEEMKIKELLAHLERHRLLLEQMLLTVGFLKAELTARLNDHFEVIKS